MSWIGKGVKGSVILIRPVLVGCCLQSAFCCSLQAQQESKAHTEHTQYTHTEHTHTHTHMMTAKRQSVTYICASAASKTACNLLVPSQKQCKLHHEEWVVSANGTGGVERGAEGGKMGAAGRWLRRLAYSCAISRLTKHIIFAHFYGNEWIVECFA